MIKATAAIIQIAILIITTKPFGLDAEPRAIELFRDESEFVEPVNLTNHTGDDFDAVWSHDGKRIAFYSTRNPNSHPGWEMYFMNADGTAQTAFSDTRQDFRPAFSPDGTKVSFDSARDGNHEIYIADADGNNPIRLTNDPAYDSAPQWLPDGKKLLYFSGPNPLVGAGYGNSDIFIINVDGSARKNLTNFEGDDTYPVLSPDGKKIAFTSYRDGNSEIYVMNIDGSNQVRLTDNPARDDNARWSPDSKQIGFWSNRDGNREGYVMNADGSNQMNVTKNPAEDFSPSWSPDGRFITFSSKREGDYEIFLAPAPGRQNVQMPSRKKNLSKFTYEDKNNLFNVTKNIGNDMYPSWSPDGKMILFSSDRHPSLLYGGNSMYIVKADGSELTAPFAGGTETLPAWSPDGKKVSFQSTRDGNSEIYVMDADGANLIRLTDEKGDEGCPKWSPDGKGIIYHSQNLSHAGAPYDVFVMNSDGSNKINLTNNPARDSWASWSPDGKRIAFGSNREGNSEIYAMDADGKNLVRLTDNPANDNYPVWSPDGRKIAFVSTRDGNLEIYSMNADGTNQTNLTCHPALDTGPAAWSPDGKKIAFISKRQGNFEIYLMDVN